MGEGGKDVNIVALGGGTGLSTLLRGLKKRTSRITAVVTVADDGGGSGVLRQDLGMLPPGDIRNCILALANTEPIMYKLLNYRFTEGMLKGQSFGNLFLAAMNGISGNFEEAVRRMSDVLAVVGRVLPVTLANIQLKAVFDDGGVIIGESRIPEYSKARKARIVELGIQPDDAEPLPEVINALETADCIVLGPGSLYTSILPNLLIPGVSEAINRSPAKKVYVLNIMTQPGETDGYAASDHVKELMRIGKITKIDYIVANSMPIPLDLLKFYLKDGAYPVYPDGVDVYGTVVSKGLVKVVDGLIRHDEEVLADTILSLI